MRRNRYTYALLSRGISRPGAPARGAALLTQAGVAISPVVAGKQVTAEAIELARRQQVWQVMDGHALRPESIAKPPDWKQIQYRRVSIPAFRSAGVPEEEEATAALVHLHDKQR